MVTVKAVVTQRRQAMASIRAAMAPVVNSRGSSASSWEAEKVIAGLQQSAADTSAAR